MKKTRIVAALLAAIIPAILSVNVLAGAAKSKKTLAFYKVRIDTGHILMRDTPSVNSKIAGVFYRGDDCVPAPGDTKKADGLTWLKVYNPYLRSTGWVNAKLMVPAKSNCKFEKFLYSTRGKPDWVFSSMTFPHVISSPNVEEAPASYTKEEVLASTKNLYDGPYYYLQLLDDAGMKKFWSERDGCAKYELIENSKFDVNSYVLYIVTKNAGEASITISCNEMYPEFKFKETENGYILTGILDSGS